MALVLALEPVSNLGLRLRVTRNLSFLIVS